MEFRIKSGQREIVRIAMALLTKQAEKAQKLLTALNLPTMDVDTMLSRAGIATDAMDGHVELPVQLGLALRGIVRQGLLMFLEEVEGTKEDELKLGIDIEGSSAKADEIRALAAMLAEQGSFSDALAVQ